MHQENDCAGDGPSYLFSKRLKWDMNHRTIYKRRTKNKFETSSHAYDNISMHACTFTHTHVQIFFSQMLQLSNILFWSQVKLKNTLRKKTQVIMHKCFINIHSGLQAGCWSILTSSLFPLWVFFPAKEKLLDWVDRISMKQVMVGMH